MMYIRWKYKNQNQAKEPQHQKDDPL